MSPGFTQVFGGGNIYPVQPSYSALTYAANISLAWPIEQAIAGALVVTDIIDLNPQGVGLTVSMPDARQVSTGFTALFNNISGLTATVLDNNGGTLLTLTPATVWQLYLIDNTTPGGTWRLFQFGASVSVAVAAALAGAGLTALGATLNEQMVVQQKSANYSVISSDRASILQWTAGVGTFTLPTPGTVGANWFVVAKNQGNGNLTISPSTGTIDGNASAVLAPGQSAWYFTDGSNFFSLTGGQSTGGGSFNLLQITVPGAGTLVLSGGQLNQIGYKFTGALTGNLIVQVPNTAQEYWVDNETTGAFSLSIATAGQASPPAVPQGARYILYCDGTNVVNALTNSVVFPITIGQGGTGATTAGGALTNLGLVFPLSIANGGTGAATAGAALAALGAVATTTQVIAGTGLTGGGALSGNVTLNALNTIQLGIKAANRNVTTTAFVNDPDLALTLVPGTYLVTLNANYTPSGAGTNPGLWGHLGFTGTVSGPGNFTSIQSNMGSTSFASGPTSGGSNPPVFPITVVNAANISSLIDTTITTLIFTVATGGTLQMSWAQQVSSAVAAVIGKGSYLMAQRLA